MIAASDVAIAPVRFSAPVGRAPVGGTLAGLTALGIGAVGLLHLDRLPLSVCFLKFATGCPCPTCGTTRALGRLFARDVPGAFAMNPLATAGVFVVALWGLLDLLLLPGRRAIRASLSPGAATVARWTALVLILANWAYLIAAGR